MLTEQEVTDLHTKFLVERDDRDCTDPQVAHKIGRLGGTGLGGAFDWFEKDPATRLDAFLAYQMMFSDYARLLRDRAAAQPA